MMEVRYIDKTELRKWWGWVKKGLEKVLEKTPESWIPEDLYCDCYENRSMLWVAMVNSRPVGFFVIQGSNENLHVWVAYLEKPNREHLMQGFEHIKGIARHGGCQTITFSSFRRGWDKQATAMGFKPRTWICEV